MPEPEGRALRRCIQEPEGSCSLRRRTGHGDVFAWVYAILAIGIVFWSRNRQRSS